MYATLCTLYSQNHHVILVVSRFGLESLIMLSAPLRVYLCPLPFAGPFGTLYLSLLLPFGFPDLFRVAVD